VSRGWPFFAMFETARGRHRHLSKTKYPKKSTQIQAPSATFPKVAKKR
jgi:hypothetical protein